MIPIPTPPELPTHARVVALAIYPQEPRVVITTELLRITEETVTTTLEPTIQAPDPELPPEGATGDYGTTQQGEPSEGNPPTDPEEGLGTEEFPEATDPENSEPPAEPETVTHVVVHEKRLDVRQIELSGPQVAELMAMAPMGDTIYDCVKHCVYGVLGDVLVL